MTTPVFDLKKPNNYICWIANYVDDKPQIVISVKHYGSYKPESIVYFVFLGVQYFAGPMKWIGAKFILGTKSEKRSLMRSYSILPSNIKLPSDAMLLSETRSNEDWDDYFQMFNIYKVKSLQGVEIKIIAHQALMTSEYPGL